MVAAGADTPILAPGPFQPFGSGAVGPDYSEGQPFIPWWIPNNLSPGKVVVVPANYGQEGGMTRYEARTNRNRDVVNASNPRYPSSLTHRPVWNILIPSINWHLHVLTKQQLQTFENAQNIQAPQVPMTFSAPGTASLLK